MLYITKDTSSTVLFTGTENALLTNPFFLFVFINRVTNQDVRVVVTNTSTAKTRYDKAVIDGNIFDGYDEGLWSYDVYEQASSSGTSTTGKNKVESGYMMLVGLADTNTYYSANNNTFVTYGE